MPPILQSFSKAVLLPLQGIPRTERGRAVAVAFGKKQSI